MTRVIRVRKSDPRLNVRGQSRADQDRAAAFNTWMPHPAATATIRLSRDQIRVVLPSVGQSCRRLVTCNPIPPPLSAAFRVSTSAVYFDSHHFDVLIMHVLLLYLSHHPFADSCLPSLTFSNDTIKTGGAGRTSSFPTHTSPFPSLPRKTRRRRRIKPSTFLSFNS
ncbi:hypothetical protein OPV22_017705 [Ensete ventricosum]|uniref:Uncharacterized protein n=1 Tax=Ensete ventricosum TaxID=4639 RepID=A0AAV8R0B3_ENSVE|nr:hypothetical protein OPV22_017705 [Ensete ventricosum]